MLRSLTGRLDVCAALLLALGLAPGAASAQSLNLDVSVSGGLPGFVYPGALPQTGTWNGVDPNAPSGLVGLDGQPVAATLTASGFGAEVFHNAHGGYNGQLVNDGFAVEGVSTWRFDGLDPGEYEVATFAWEPIVQVERLEVEVLGSPDGVLEVGQPVHCSVLRGSHVRHRVVSTGTIEVVVRELGVAGTVNAFQLRLLRPGSGPCALTEIVPPAVVPGLRGDMSLSGDAAVFTGHHTFEETRVFVYSHGSAGWTHTDELVIPTVRPFYGDDLALDGSTCLVASPPFYDPTIPGPSPGKVFVFDEGASGWALSQTIDPPPGVGSFGTAVDLSGARGVIGTPDYQGVGTAHIVDRSGGGWVITAQLDAATHAGSWYGSEVALDGSYAFVAARHETVAGLLRAGAVYVFERTPQGWENRARLTAEAPIANARYGTSLSASGGRVLIGAPGGQGFTGGLAEFWEKTPTGWERGQKLRARDGWEADCFGDALDFSGDQAIVGARNWSEPCGTTGAAFLFERAGGTWQLVERIGTGTPSPHETGASVGLHSGRFVVSVDAAPVELFAGDCAPRVGTTYCSPAIPNSTGLAAGIDASGSASADVGSLTLRAGGMPPQEFGLFLTSMTDGSVAGPGGSDGVLCLGGQIARFASSVLSTGSEGRFELEIDTTAIPTTPAQPVLAGQTWRYQAWFRDAASSNFTDAVSVTFE